MRRKNRRALAKQRELILGKHYRRVRSQGISTWDRRLTTLSKELQAAPSLAWALNEWNPQPPKYLIQQVEGAILSSRLVGKALLWRDAHQRGYFGWAQKGVSGITDQAARLKYTGWTEAPLGSASEAWRWFSKKAPVTKDEFKVMVEAARAKAWTIADADNRKVVAATKGLIEEAIAGQRTVAEVVKESRAAWDALGVTKANPYHLETAARTSIHTAANAARWSELQRDTQGLREFFPLLEFVTVGDEALCDTCEPLDGRVYRRDDGFWMTYYPPLHFNCRCLVIEVSVIDIEAEGIKPGEYPTSPLPAPGFDRMPEAA